jgi:hypothetical protein
MVAKDLKVCKFKFSDSRELTDKFLLLRERIYWDDYYYYNDTSGYRRILDYYSTRSNYDFEMVLIEENGDPIARAVAGVCDELSWAFFGMFECIDDKRIFNILMNEAISFAKSKGKKEIRGPFDFNGVHGWSFLISSSTPERWVGDPYHKSYYPKMFAGDGWQQVDKMYSCYASDKSMEYFIDYHHKVKDEMLARGLRREVYGDRPFEEYLSPLISLINRNFDSVENKHVRVEASLMKEELMKMSYFIKEPEWLMMFFLGDEMIGYNYGFANFIDDLCNPGNLKSAPDPSERVKPMFSNKNFSVISSARDMFSKFILSYTYVYAESRYKNTIGGRRMLYEGHWGKVNLNKGVFVTQDYAAFSKNI